MPKNEEPIVGYLLPYVPQGPYQSCSPGHCLHRIPKRRRVPIMVELKIGDPK